MPYAVIPFLLAALFAALPLRTAGAQAVVPAEEVPLEIPAAKIYAPAVLLGNVAAPKRLSFFWSTTSRESVDLFRKVVAPLLVKEPKEFSVLLYQMSDTAPPQTFGAGSLLLCSDSNADYQSYVREFLSRSLPNPTTTTFGKIDEFTIQIDENVSRIFASRHAKAVLGRCVSNPIFRYRLAQLFRQSEILIRDHNVTRVPTLMVNGEIVREPSTAELKRLLGQ